jgi:hypothetical protein
MTTGAMTKTLATTKEDHEPNPEARRIATAPEYATEGSRYSGGFSEGGSTPIEGALVDGDFDPGQRRWPF